MRHFMIDLETMSTEPNAAILSIGAVEMDFSRFEFKRGFYRNVELSSCRSVGLHESVATRDWWAAREPEARDALTKDAVSVYTALQEFRGWLWEDPVNVSEASQSTVMPWSNGAGFDVVILESAYRACGLIAPWQFYNTMCYRTIKNLYVDVPKPLHMGVKHQALDDAKTQAWHLFDIAKKHPGSLGQFEGSTAKRWWQRWFK